MSDTNIFNSSAIAIAQKAARPVTASKESGMAVRPAAGLPMNYYDPKRAMWKQRGNSGLKTAAMLKNRQLLNLTNSVHAPNLQLKSMFCKDNSSLTGALVT